MWPTPCWAAVRYYFDTRDNVMFDPDEIGIEFTEFEKVKREAADGLAELARDVLPGSEGRLLSIEVRDESGLSVLITSMAFEVRVLIER